MRSRLFGLAAAAAGVLVLASSALHAQETVTNSIGMVFIRVEPGTMRVGAYKPEAPKDHAEQAGMAHTAWTDGFDVSVRKPFYLGAYEVTQEQWARVMGSNPATFRDKDGPCGGRNRPVESISWRDAQRFVQRLNKLEQTKRYRLPTEFEWELAARAGGPGDSSDPPFDKQGVGGYNALRCPSPVGSKAPNAFGFHDMLGNVWEWVADIDNGKMFADPTPPKRGTNHVIKGGSFLTTGLSGIPATHAGGPASGYDVGLRIARD